MKYASVSNAFIELIKELEGFSRVVYKDSAGYDTIGVGHLIRYQGDPNLTEVTGIIDPKAVTKLTLQEVDELLILDLKERVEFINERISFLNTQNQFEAVLSFLFNVGERSFKKGTELSRDIDEGKINEIPYDMIDYCKYTDSTTGEKKISRGLLKRRYIEFFIYKGQLDDISPESKKILTTVDINAIKASVIKYFRTLNESQGG